MAKERRRIVHDLRAPLHALSGFLDLAISDNTDPEVARSLDAAKRAATQFADLIADLSGDEDIPVEIDLHSFVNSTLELLAPLTTSHSIDLGGCPGTRVSVPARALQRVVSNLVINAIRHTPVGSQILVSAESDPPRITIDDEGPGPSSIVAGGHDNSRLGLLIVGELLERRIGGRLEVEERHPIGSKVVVVLPDS